MINEKLVSLFKSGKSCLNKEKNSYDMMVYPEIPEGKAGLARSNFNIGYEETILLIRDTSFWNNVDQGCVITDQAVYFILDNDNKEDTKYTVDWGTITEVKYLELDLHFYFGDGSSTPVSTSHFMKTSDDSTRARIGRQLATLFSQMAATCEPQESKEHSEFKTEFDSFFDNIDTIIKNEESVRQYIKRQCKYKDNFEFAFLRALAAVEFLYCTDRSCVSIAEEGLIHTKTALALLDDPEVHILDCILRLFAFQSENNPDPLKDIRKIDNSCPIIEDLENNYIKVSFLREVYDEILEDKIFDAYRFYSNKDRDPQALKCLERMNLINTQYSSVVSNVFLSDYYSQDPHKDDNKAFQFALAAYNTSDFEYDNEIRWHSLWLKSIVRLSYCYATGYGVKLNGSKAFEFAQKAADLEDNAGYYNLANCYEDGLGVKQDKKKALELYRVAQEKGFDASDKIGRLEKELNIEPERERDADKKNYRYDIFISYSRKNSEIVNQMVGILEKEGYSVWIDRDGIESGDSFKLNIVTAIEQSQVVLFFSSEDSNRSSWTAKEVGAAVLYNKEIIPIKLDNTRYNKEVLLDLVNLDYVDYSDPATKEDNLQKLLRSLSSKIVLSSEEEILLTEDEQEYYDAIREILEEDGDISSRERRVLERLRISLDISADRAKQIEAMFNNSLSEEEQEYIDTYRDMTADGPLSERDRRILDRIMKASGITQERARQLEKMC